MLWKVPFLWFLSLGEKCYPTTCPSNVAGEFSYWVWRWGIHDKKSIVVLFLTPKIMHSFFVVLEQSCILVVVLATQHVCLGVTIYTKHVCMGWNCPPPQPHTWVHVRTGRNWIRCGLVNSNANVSVLALRQYYSHLRCHSWGKPSEGHTNSTIFAIVARL